MEGGGDFIRSLTRAHMDALHAFLLRRTRYLLGAHRPGTEEHRAATALHLAIEWTWEELQDCFSCIDDEDVLLELGDCWSRLRGFALSWMDAPDYDEALWPPTRFEHMRFVDPPGH